MNIFVSLALLASFFSYLDASGSPRQLPNIPYGSDPAQVLDLYLPLENDGGENGTKVLLLIHGGAWGGGAKWEMEHHVSHLQRDLPSHYIANMEYRLGTHASPGFPKQLEDIFLAITFLKSSFTQAVTFGLMGGSAGAHLSMLYSYSWDRELGTRDVKVVVDIVGPTDITHPSYIEGPLGPWLFLDLVGGCTYSDCPEMYAATSPITWVTEESPPTIGFYGDVDPLIPDSQMPIIREALNGVGVPNNFTIYSGGHGDWDWAGEDQADMRRQIKEFCNANW